MVSATAARTRRIMAKIKEWRNSVSRSARMDRKERPVLRRIKRIMTANTSIDANRTTVPRTTFVIAPDHLD